MYYNPRKKKKKNVALKPLPLLSPSRLPWLLTGETEKDQDVDHRQGQVILATIQEWTGRVGANLFVGPKKYLQP